MNTVFIHVGMWRPLIHEVLAQHLSWTRKPLPLYMTKKQHKMNKMARVFDKW